MPGFYGTSFDDLEDEQRDPVSKKPTPIQDQVATDERGRRRFHGAFTGGFSAGYFNTVGSKHGWAPQEFRSSRDGRADKVAQLAEDFMDAEDLGEFGISSRRIRQTAEFSSVTTQQEPLLAWERGGSSRASDSKDNQLANDLQMVIRPVSDSAGVRMLRRMGWRQGRAVGMATIREAAASRQISDVDREQLTKLAPNWVASAEDEKVVEMEPLAGRHGLGYNASLADKKDSLSQKYGRREAILKGKAGRGIRGQAFGVGAFEDEDESVYSSFDLSQYDFAIGPGPSEKQIATPDSTFVPASSRLAPRKFFAPPRLPDNFKSQHKLVALDKSSLPIELQALAQEMSSVQRCKFFGDNRAQLVNAVASEKKRKSRWDVKEEEESVGESRKWREAREEEQDEGRRRAGRIEFPSEPLKQARFKEYLGYVRRGLCMPQPRDMSVWEWDNERNEFETRLLPDERALLPDVIARTKPLAKTALALPLMDLMRSKFIGETNAPSQNSAKDEDRLAAVKAEMFGEKTRRSWEWHPSHGLAKMFNVPNPFPGSGIVGLPHLMDKKKKKAESLLNLGLPNTANELAFRSSVYEVGETSRHREHGKERERERRGDERRSRDNGRDREKERETEKRRGSEKKEVEDVDDDASQEEDDRPPPEFLAAIFGAIGMDSANESDDEEEQGADKEKDNNTTKQERTPEENGEKDGVQSAVDTSEHEQQPTQEKVITVMDLDEEYGPMPPPGISSSSGLTGFSVLRFNAELMKKVKKRKRISDDEEPKKRKKARKEKKSKKEKKKKEKKSMKSKKLRRRTASSSASTADSDSSIQTLN